VLLIYEKYLDFSICIKTKIDKMADIIEEFNEYRSRMNENFWQTTTKLSKEYLT
jgi:hypothetical protein